MQLPLAKVDIRSTTDVVQKTKNDSEGDWKTSEGSDALSTAFQKVDVLTGDLSGGYCTGTDIAEDRV